MPCQYIHDCHFANYLTELFARYFAISVPEPKLHFAVPNLEACVGEPTYYRSVLEVQPPLDGRWVVAQVEHSRDYDAGAMNTVENACTSDISRRDMDDRTHCCRSKWHLCPLRLSI
jgi:hypothetical protein